MEPTKEAFREEVTRFRSTFKPEAIDTAAKSITLEKRGNVGVIVFDQYQEKANKLSSPNLLRFYELLTQIEADRQIEAIVLISRKPTIFIAGADIGEIQRFTAGEADVNTLMKLQSVFTYLERLPIPSVAAIHGACMGGGTELTLACDYRMATDAPETKIALPEVMLGVIPGWGGTQRMPKLLGLEKSLDLILTGRSVDGRRARKMGLVDKVAPREWLEEKAVAWASELGRAKSKAKKEADPKGRLLEMVPGGKWVIFDQARKKLLEKTKGNYPAPLAALEVIRKTYGGPLDAGLKVEAEAFAELVRTPEAKNLIGVYYLNERVKKEKGVAKPVETPEIRRVGVLGAGVMGGGIAQLFAQKGISVRLKDVSWDAIAKGTAAAYRVFKKQLERRKIQPFELANAMERVSGTTTYSGFASLDLVVEAVVEDLEIKRKVFADLESKCGPETVFATNTSSLSLAQMGSGLKDPARLVGMHFFNPVDKMPLIEVIRSKATSDRSVATVFSLSKKLGKTPIVVKDSPGFLVNRILAPYLNETVYLIMEGVPVARIDSVMEKFGMPMGPCALLDEVGLDVAAKVSKVLYGAFGDRMKPPAVMDLIVAEKRFGKKTGKGIYIYSEGGKKREEDPTLGAKLGVPSAPATAVSDDDIVKRLVYVMINEAARCLEEEVVREAADVDVGMIFGTGFAPFRGGLLRHADTVGPETIVGEMELYSRTLGARFQPCTFLQGLAVGGKKFYPA